eukprot:TRINITY_DN41026_c0_g1_i1.p1 TRINITY_DN41026_c0_g1~~TRINITY_DN41026_c0_g1_i1.p1  ORF type:complete len:301 (+),score=57.54 TRINITY_DN41026_c0_g1_i1:89-991(+)
MSSAARLKELEKLRSSLTAKQEAVSVHPGTLLFWQKLCDDEEAKDVIIETADGVVRAHSLLLRSISDPLKAMLSHGMLEGTTKKVQMLECTTSQLSFFLRVASTGIISEQDMYPGCQPEPSSQCEYKIDVQVLAKDGDGDNVVDFRMRSSTRFEKMMKAWCQHHGVDQSEALFELEGRELKPDDTPASCGVLTSQRKVVILAKPRDEGTASSPQSPPEGGIKLELLFGSASLARKYMAAELFERFIDRIKLQLTACTFDSVMDFAIKEQMIGLHSFCLRFAELDPHVEDSFKRQAFSSHV